MKILLLHGDIFPWATWNRCKELKKRWINDIVDIEYYENLSKLNLDEYDVIHIMFSGGMGKLASVVNKHRDKVYTSIASVRTLSGVYDNIDVLIEMYKNSKKIVSQNKNLAEQLISMIGEKYRDKIVYIPNGVDENLFDKEFVVGFVGNKQSSNAEYKGYHLIEKACGNLGVKLLSNNDSYSENFTVHDDMPEFYKKISCLVIASLGEGCNNPTLEALSMNVPVISTDTGIVRELEGITIVDRDVESIQNAIKKFYLKKQILENYTWDIISNKYKQLYV